jgi:hypothetical protein
MKSSHDVEGGPRLLLGGVEQLANEVLGEPGHLRENLLQLAVDGVPDLRLRDK